MKDHYLPRPIQTQEGWRVIFAFNAHPLQTEKWLEMRWGFSAAFLLDEALDRQRLFIESLSIPAEMLLASGGLRHSLAMRGTNALNGEVQIALIGRVDAPSEKQAEIEAQNYAHILFSTFPYDFVLVPAHSQEEHDRLLSTKFFAGNLEIVNLQRSFVPVPISGGYARLGGFWNSSMRANEQIWRALAGMQFPTAFNIALQPTVFYDGEKQFLEKLLKTPSAGGMPGISPSPEWMEACAKRRLDGLKKIFLLQIHILVDGGMDENLARSIGSVLTRDTAGFPSLGYRVEYPASNKMKQIWREQVQHLEIAPVSTRLDDLADLEEVCSVFQFPYRPKLGLPGVNFIEAQQ